MLIRSAVLVLVDSVAFATTSFRSESANDVLLVRVDAIGDLVLWLPSADLLARYYLADRKPILICNQVCAELAVATGFFEKVIGVDLYRLTRDLKYRFRTMRLIAKLGSSICVQPTYSRVFLTGDSIVRASGAKSRIGCNGNLANMRAWEKYISDRWYTQLVPASALPMMELDRNAEFIRNLGAVDCNADLFMLPNLLELPIEKRLGDGYFVVFPGASSPTRMWPVKSFAAVAKQIVHKYGLIPVVCGGEIERNLGDRLLQQIGDERGKNFAGKTSLPELVEIIREARLVVSNETSAIHISAAVSTPSVCILGGGHYGRFMPYSECFEGIKPVPVINKMSCFGCNWRCQFTNDSSRPYPCIEAVPVDEVLRAVNLTLNPVPMQRF